MKTARQNLLGSLICGLLLTSLAQAEEPLILFGLRHSPLGGANVANSYGSLYVTSGGGGENEEGEFGVSVALGEADSGIWGELSDSSSFYSTGNFMIGHVYGQLNGVPDMEICSLRAETLDPNGVYAVAADFSPMGSSSVTYELFNGKRLVAVAPNQTAPAIIYSYSGTSPRANPFCKSADGSVVAVIEFSAPRWVRLPNMDYDQSMEGDRIMIRPENTSGTVDFASHVDLWAGGGESTIIVSQESLGMFNRPHKALGESLLQAQGGVLTIARQQSELSAEIGVSVELDPCRNFGMQLQPVELLTDGGTLLISAIGTRDTRVGEFLGYAGVQNQSGMLKAFADFSAFANQVQVGIYRHDLLVATRPWPAIDARVSLSGSPRIAGVAASADMGPVSAGLAIRFDQVTTFSLPDQWTAAGDEIRFQVANTGSGERLSSCSVTFSNLAALTITGETGSETLSLLTYFPEVVAPAFVKAFTGSNNGQETSFTRTLTRTNRNGHALALMTDHYSETTAVSATYSFQEDGLHFYGSAQPAEELFSPIGLRVLPEQITVGQSYFSMGSFEWRDTSSGVTYPVGISCLTRVAALEAVSLPSGLFSALRLETVLSFTGAGDVPTNWWSTNWLAAGVGVIKLIETEAFANGTARTRTAELTDYAIVNTPVRTQSANVGANIIISVDVSTPGTPWIEWRKNGESMEQAGWGNSRLVLNNLQDWDAGLYSVQVGMGGRPDTLVSDIAALSVIPFSDTPPFWATAIGAQWGIVPRAVTTDSAGNAYVAGYYRGNLIVGDTNYPSRGNEDIFIMKVLPSGERAWVRTAGGIYGDIAQSLATDASGNVYMAGGFLGTITLGALQLSSPAPIRVDPLFVTKLDGNGNFLWAVANGGSATASCTAMSADAAGNLYVVGGFFGGTAVFGGTTLSNEYGSADLFFTKLNAQGQFLWARQVSDESSNQQGGISIAGQDLTVDNSGNVFLAGRFGEQITFDGITLLSGQSSWTGGGFLAKADSNGHFLWARMIGRNVSRISADLLGKIYVTGEFSGLTRFDAVLLSSRTTWTDFYLAQFEADGALGWVRTSPHQPFYYNSPLVADNQGNLYVAGTIYNEGNYAGTTFSQPYESSTMLSKLDPRGRTLWHKQIAGSGGNWPECLGRDNAGNVYLAGSFGHEIRFGHTSVTSSPYASAFLVKITGATAPTLTQQPQSQTVNLGEPVSFTVSATGTEPLSYQWRKNEQKIAGANSSTYTLANVSAEDAGLYSVVVKNAGGIVISDNATLQVTVPDAGTFAFGESTYTVDESNGWLFVTIVRTGNTSVAANVELVTLDGTAFAGEDFWTTVISVQFAPGEVSKTVMVPIIDNWPWEPTENFVLRLVRPGPGAAVGQQDTATVTITDNDVPGAPVIRVQPASRVVMVGQPVAFGIVADGAEPLSYQWRKDGVDLPDMTNRSLMIPEARFTDAGIYSVIVRNDIGEVTSLDAALTVMPLPDIHFVMFGLTNRPLGQVRIATNNGAVEITPLSLDYEESFGVSITLGEADSGAFGYLSTGGSFQNEGDYTAGSVYGQLNGVPNQFLCSLKATTVDWYGRYAVEADFGPLAPSSVTYQVFNHDQLEASEEADGAIYICDYTEYSPAANPFWRLPDGTIAAVIQLSAPRPIQLSGGSYVTGDRILIRAENTAGVVDFASRIDVTAGGGEELIYLNQERLGMFNRSHLALGDSILKASGGQLTVAQLHSNAVASEIGTSVALEQTHHLKVQLQPQDLAGDGASLMASAVGNGNGQISDFLGYAALRKTGGSLQIAGDLPCSPAGMQVVVYRNGSPVGTVPTTAHPATIALSGNPRVVDFEVAADNGLTPPWLAVQLDGQTSFLLPDGSSVEGDQIRFRAMSSVPMNRLNAFSLTASNVMEFTITAESGLQPVGLADYLPEILMPHFLKKFNGSEDGTTAQFIRTSTRTNLNGPATVMISDRAGETTVGSVFYSAKEGGVRWHGSVWAGQSLSSGAGLFLLPDEIVVGQSFIGQGSFLWQDQASAEQALLEVNAVSSLSWDRSSLPDGTSSGLRLETVLTFSGSQSLTAPVSWRCTNWLAPGLGVVRFSESMTDTTGQTRQRWGELTDAVILKTEPQTAVANIGANIVLSIETVKLGAGSILEWQKDGVSIEESSSERIYLNQLQNSDAGTYSVVLGILKDGLPEITANCEVARVHELPFSDTPPFWAGQLSASLAIDANSTAVDGEGNIYVAGQFRGTLHFGSNSITNNGQLDIFLAKFNSTGQLLWLQTAGGVNGDFLQAMGLDAAGNVYLTGTFYRDATFGSVHVSGPTTGSTIFVAQVSPNGSFVWAVASAGTGTVDSHSMAVDSSGNVYVLGDFYQGILTFGSISLTNYFWENRLFLAKLNDQGQCLWITQTTGTVYPSAAVADSAGAIYLCGLFYSPATFGQLNLTAGPSGNGFLTKMDSNGNFVWAHVLGGDARNLTVDHSGNICVSGEFYGLINLGGVWLSSQADQAGFYLAKFSPAGIQQWARHSPQQPSNYRISLGTDNSDNVYVAGAINGETAYEGTTFFATYDCNTMLSKLDPSGRSLWHKQISGSAGNSPRSLARDNAGNVYLAGDFRGQILFGETSLTATDSTAAYLVKITGATAPSLTQQPQPQTVNLGEPATFTVSATGTEPLGYQWRKNEQAIPGATSSTYTLASASAEDAAEYSVVVKNAGGIVMSGNARLQVAVPEAGTVLLSAAEYNVAETNPLAVVTVLRTGDSSRVATVELRTADETALAGLDYVQTAVSLRFAPGQTLKTAAIPILYNPEWEPTESFTVRLGSAGPGVTLGQPAFGLVNIMDYDVLGMPVIQVQPGSHRIIQGEAVNLFVNVSGAAPLIYQWRKDGLPVTGATGRWFTIAAAQASDAGIYSVLVRNSVGEILSADATLAVLMPPVIVTPLQNQNISCGEAVTFSIVAPQGNLAPGEPLTYRWRKDGIEIQGANGPTLTLDPVDLSDAGTYTVIITDQNGLDASSSATLNVVGPILHIDPVAGQLQFWWKAGEYHLEVSDDPIQGGWQDVQGAFSTMIMPASAARKFFRLVTD